ncbi:NAD kinase [Roseateles sp. BYS180W]|uniref:NAD kinase n=1 Tax=Roseateles rivi TaxID=3299028 RepID=A0ABW7FXH9_9BURK
MSKRFRHVAIVGKHQARGIRPVLEEIAEFVSRQGLVVCLEQETAHNTGLSQYDALSPEELGAQCDLAIVVGGDGTMLGFARQAARHGLPLVGINQGRLGFITDITVEHFRDALLPILAGDFERDERALLQGSVWRDGQNIFEGLALNDVVVSRGATASMVELRVDVGQEFVAHMRADGVIVGTPTGSTAYALSAGGPILHPRIQGWVLLPIASHTLSNRPIVLPDDGEVRLTIVAGRDASVNFDSHSLASLLHGDCIRVRRSELSATFIHPRGWSCYATLRRKLRWYEGSE